MSTEPPPPPPSPPAAVFLISGLLLKTDDIKKAWQYKLGVAFGFLSTLAITPCLGFAFRAIPLTPQAYTIGLVLNTAVPQTLGIGISLVRSCGGNEGLALMLTGVQAVVAQGLQWSLPCTGAGSVGCPWFTPSPPRRLPCVCSCPCISRNQHHCYIHYATLAEGPVLRHR